MAACSLLGILPSVAGAPGQEESTVAASEMEISSAPVKSETASSVTVSETAFSRAEAAEKSISALAKELGLPAGLTIHEMEYNVRVGDDIEEGDLPRPMMPRFLPS